MVGVVILESEREYISKLLENIENTSGKRTKKWRKAPHRNRKAYVESITTLTELRNSLFFGIHEKTKGRKYIDLSSYTTARAISKKAGTDDFKVHIYVDGLTKTERLQFTQGLRELGVLVSLW